MPSSRRSQSRSSISLDGLLVSARSPLPGQRLLAAGLPRQRIRRFEVGLELVAESIDRLDQLARAGVRLELAAQAGDVNVDVSLETVEVVAKRLLDQLSPREDLARRQRHHLEQVELGWRQPDGALLDTDLATLRKNHQRPDRHLLRPVQLVGAGRS